MADKVLPSPEVLRQLLRYDPDTGKLFWRERAAQMFPHPRDAIRWNARRSGAEAFIAISPQGYRVGQIGRITMRAHRVIWAMCKNEWPISAIDHIDGNPANNKICNLRDVPQAENCRNASARKDNSSGAVGVRWQKANRKWVVTVGNIYIGIFADFSEAVSVRKSAAVERGFHENHGRQSQ